MTWQTYTSRLILDTGSCLACCPDERRSTYDEPLDRKTPSIFQFYANVLRGNPSNKLTCPRCQERYTQDTTSATESIIPSWEELQGLSVRRQTVADRREAALKRYRAELERFADTSFTAGDSKLSGDGPDIVSIHAEPQLRFETVGIEHRIFNNLGSDSDSTETLHISQVVNFHIQLQIEAEKVGRVEAQIGPSWAAVKGFIEQRLLQRHGKSYDSTLGVEQTSTLIVPARRLVRVTLQWKRAWEDGTVIVGDPSRPQFVIPYHMTTALAYDKTTEDHVSDLAG